MSSHGTARSHPRSARLVLTAAVTAGVLAAGVAPASAHSTSAPPAPSSYSQLLPLTTLSAERLATADLVAAAKWGTDSPIDDPAREQIVLESVRRLALEAGTDPKTTVAIFRDQIEANKLVQRGLHALWTADPSKAPAERPDLTEVRKEINRINAELVRAVAGSERARAAWSCRGVLAVTAVHVRHEKQLDQLHTRALVRAVPSVCPAR
ncbi:gamma subclass chorismate mutase AroQ [Streptomyces tsukubensis]|uniref:chorismate mutase n=1 Tax=Streptomyces tsukubensis (strain DSM 42081 / NBRC 108919 / NRRL 18488 / 9993) TaxID=1114943 RepID=I2N0S2_STRT9|nr:chorismate mutase [Streptomyces tsukubensis]EIF90619.1 chorismate mutase [Streptomyces tsukubensis NRRL18488]MYS68746.1 gamma subclass chorismate mutase AroQ [Streptomyces sp. SID5473]QKM69109.1 gamma subclass chorismate mutase AroQ [Streptomyces tsukubensis NRRL18488]TAI42959.1 gamma subclass chorismate mutase AroQ [Streptomyces tsukubensis]